MRQELEINAENLSCAVFPAQIASGEKVVVIVLEQDEVRLAIGLTPTEALHFAAKIKELAWSQVRAGKAREDDAEAEG
jgi:hypothetical protein